MQIIYMGILIIGTVLGEIWMVTKVSKVFKAKKSPDGEFININSNMMLWIFIIWAAMMGGGTLFAETLGKLSFGDILNLWWLGFLPMLWQLVRSNIVILKADSMEIALDKKVRFDEIQSIEIRDGKRNTKVLAIKSKDGSIAYVPGKDEYEINKLYQKIKGNLEGVIA